MGLVLKARTSWSYSFQRPQETVSSLDSCNNLILASPLPTTWPTGNLQGCLVLVHTDGPDVADTKAGVSPCWDEQGMWRLLAFVSFLER